ncbi:basic proline-rich protein-like [Prionailurus viverrinus]|uniref:basic proline-rich protein-like n=1 Tax=Prionailurus viverrinus TaxID=61388 RepID=UPI001FF520AF|nr:basic proline-rich protein-like [Prionailurus viverrinus]
MGEGDLWTGGFGSRPHRCPYKSPRVQSPKSDLREPPPLHLPAPGRVRGPLRPRAPDRSAGQPAPHLHPTPQPPRSGPGDAGPAPAGRAERDWGREKPRRTCEAGAGAGRAVRPSLGRKKAPGAPGEQAPPPAARTEPAGVAPAARRLGSARPARARAEDRWARSLPILVPWRCPDPPGRPGRRGRPLPAARSPRSQTEEPPGLSRRNPPYWLHPQCPLPSALCLLTPSCFPPGPAGPAAAPVWGTRSKYELLPSGPSFPCRYPTVSAQNSPQATYGGPRAAGIEDHLTQPRTHSLGLVLLTNATPGRRPRPGGKRCWWRTCS